MIGNTIPRVLGKRSSSSRMDEVGVDSEANNPKRKRVEKQYYFFESNLDNIDNDFIKKFNQQYESNGAEQYVYAKVDIDIIKSALIPMADNDNFDAIIGLLRILLGEYKVEHMPIAYFANEFNKQYDNKVMTAYSESDRSDLDEIIGLMRDYLGEDKVEHVEMEEFHEYVIKGIEIASKMPIIEKRESIEKMGLLVHCYIKSGNIKKIEDVQRALIPMFALAEEYHDWKDIPNTRRWIMECSLYIDDVCLDDDANKAMGCVEDGDYDSDSENSRNKIKNLEVAITEVATATYELGANDKAKDLCKEAIKRYNNDYSRALLAHIYTAEGKFAEAISLLKKLLSNESSYKLYCSLHISHIYYKMQSFYGMHKALELIMKIKEDYPEGSKINNFLTMLSYHYLCNNSNIIDQIIKKAIEAFKDNEYQDSKFELFMENYEIEKKEEADLYEIIEELKKVSTNDLSYIKKFVGVLYYFIPDSENRDVAISDSENRDVAIRLLTKAANDYDDIASRRNLIWIYGSGMHPSETNFKLAFKYAYLCYYNNPNEWVTLQYILIRIKQHKEFKVIFSEVILEYARQYGTLAEEVKNNFQFDHNKNRFFSEDDNVLVFFGITGSGEKEIKSLMLATDFIDICVGYENDLEKTLKENLQLVKDTFMFYIPYDLTYN